MKKLLAFLGITLFLGAGCVSQDIATSDQNAVPAQTPPAPVATVPPTTTVDTTTPTPPATSSTTPTVPPVSVDATWKTYTNNALHFSFQYPTKGSYAPGWNVTFVKATDPAMQNDCYAPSNMQTNLPSQMKDVSGVSFCHTSYAEGAAGSQYLTDYYATKIGTQYVLITFTKHLYSAGALNCKFMNQYPYSLSGSTCIAFDSATYQTLLDTSVSTFKKQ